jgi:hypothetical protein
MRVQPVAFQPITIGWLIALLVLIIAIVLIVIGQLPVVVGGLIAALALSRLV